jgi:hypothetical protein
VRTENTVQGTTLVPSQVPSPGLGRIRKKLAQVR